MYNFSSFWEYSNNCINNTPDNEDDYASSHECNLNDPNTLEYLRRYPRYKYDLLETPDNTSIDLYYESQSTSPHKLRYPLYRKKSSYYRSLYALNKYYNDQLMSKNTISYQIKTYIKNGFDRLMGRTNNDNDTNNDSSDDNENEVERVKSVDFKDPNHNWSPKEEQKRLKICISSIMQMIFFDQLAYSGILVSLTLFARTKLDISTETAASFVSIFTAMGYWTPLLAAYFADAVWGRSKTILVAQIIFLIGSIVLVFSSIMVQVSLFYISTVIIAIGYGGFKPTISPLGADQFDAKHKDTEEEKEQAKQKRSSFFGWMYWINQIGGIIASSVVAYLCQNVDFAAGWSIGTIGLALAIGSYYMAKRYFIEVPPEGSLFGKVLTIIFHGCCKSKNTTQEVPSCLDKCKAKYGGKYDDQTVDDIKIGLNALPALIPFPVSYICFTNLLTLVYSQGCQMNYFIGDFTFPIASLSLIGTTTIIIFVPLTDKLVYPLFNKMGGIWKVTTLKKMEVSFIFVIIAMFFGCITEILRKRSPIIPNLHSVCDKTIPVNNMSIFYQIPQFIFLGAARVLINTGAQEFFYTEAPKNMKSTLFSINYAADGIGALLGSVSISLVNISKPKWITNDLNEGYLEYYFLSIGLLMVFINIIFLIFAYKYEYKELKELKEGKVLRRK